LWEPPTESLAGRVYLLQMDKTSSALKARYPYDRYVGNWAASGLSPRPRSAADLVPDLGPQRNALRPGGQGQPAL